VGKLLGDKKLRRMLKAEHIIKETKKVNTPDPRRPVIRLENIYKIYQTGELNVLALRQLNLEVEKGDFVAIMGSSGSGKSTLMGIIGCLDMPTSGEYYLDGINVKELNETQLAIIRNKKIGFVFQSFNLIPRTSALANVELPLAYAGVKPKQRRKIAMRALDLVGLSDRGDHVPSKLSGGQQQRVAVARAIATNPSLILADEPTGNLDTHSSHEVMKLLSEFHMAGRTIVLITHEADIAAYANRLIRISDGHLVSDEAITDDHWIRKSHATNPSELQKSAVAQTAGPLGARNIGGRGV
jgi:putative ABC transport system ATP-binding protein